MVYGRYALCRVSIFFSSLSSPSLLAVSLALAFVYLFSIRRPYKVRQGSFLFPSSLLLVHTRVYFTILPDVDIGTAPYRCRHNLPLTVCRSLSSMILMKTHYRGRTSVGDVGDDTCL